MHETHNGVIEILNTVNKVLTSDPTLNEVVVCAGLYSYAVEEYGKLLLLSRRVPSEGFVELRYKDGIMNHQAKFEAALADLPEECKDLGEGGRTSGPSLRVTFKQRQAVFYSDLNEDLSGAVPIPPVDGTRLSTATSRLWNIVMRFRIE